MLTKTFSKTEIGEALSEWCERRGLVPKGAARFMVTPGDHPGKGSVITASVECEVAIKALQGPFPLASEVVTPVGAEGGGDETEEQQAERWAKQAYALEHDWEVTMEQKVAMLPLVREARAEILASRAIPTDSKKDK